MWSQITLALSTHRTGGSHVRDLAGYTRQGIEHLVHDFWKGQPIKGASYYYMHNVLHD
jgi:hypothetical protein